MSRLGRNYLEVGYYTDNYFPQKNIRHNAERQEAIHISREKVYADGNPDSTAAQRTDRQNRCLRNAGNGKAQNAENRNLLRLQAISKYR